MANGANYQESGTDNLRGNPQTMSASIISDKGMDKDVIPASYQKSGTEMLRCNEKIVSTPIVSAVAGNTIRAQAKPATVKSFNGASV